MIRVLFFGDVVGRIGRQALKKIIPQLKKEWKPDLIIANAENLAHGLGITRKTFDEIIGAGVDFLTSGNHIWKKEEANEILNHETNIIRPANYAGDKSGQGQQIIKIKKNQILIVNLLGQTFIDDGAGEIGNPFTCIDEILPKFAAEKLNGIIIDFHAEATSDKVALGWHLDGRVSAVLGTHTHIPTADAKILPQGTAYVTDVGMVGARDSVIGVVKENILTKYINETPKVHEIPEKGVCAVNAVLLTINPKNGQAIKIQRIDREVEIS